MQLLQAGTKSKDKTTKKYRPDIKNFFDQQTLRIVTRFNNFFNLKDFKEILNEQDLEVVLNYILPLPQENAALKQAAKPMHTSAVQKAIEDIDDIAEASVVAGLSNIAVANAIARLGDKIVNINLTTRNMIKDILAEGIANGTNLYDLANQIQDTGLDEWYANRALTIARTETRMGYDLGGKIAYKELGAETFSVVGCVSVMPGINDLGVVPGYGERQDDTSGACGSVEIQMARWDEASGVHHPNHAGVMVADRVK